MKRLMIACLLLAAPARAQEAPGRLMLEAGIDGGNDIACPGHYVGILGNVAGPVSAYVNVDNYRCAESAGTTIRAGGSLLLGRAEWLIRPAARGGLAFGGTDAVHTIGGSLTLGRRYGGRIILDRQPLEGGGALVLFQIGGYISF